MDPSPAESTVKPKWQALNSRQRRVLGVLIEKAKTTPDVYPMTVNGLVSGCNQKSNRDPVLSLSQEDVEQILDELRGLGVVAEVQGSGRVPKYRHYANEWLGTQKNELSVMAELLLRGEQTLGDLRVRASRMGPIPDQPALKEIVDALLKKKLMLELTAPGRGQVVTHGLYKEREINELRAKFTGYVPPAGNASDEEPRSLPQVSGTAPIRSTLQGGSSPPVPTPRNDYVTRDMFSELTVEVAEMRAELARTREEMRALREALGVTAGGDGEG